MGISGLLPLLRSIHKHCTLKKFAGQTIGIDAYGWLHRGTVACAIELALDKPTTKYVDFAVGRVRMLLDFGITPFLVFDGDALPSKSGTNLERRKRRDDSKALGLELYRAGKHSQAHQELQKAADVTPQMARQLIEELKRLNVQYIVAPYEADAQLAYLERKGIINGILSEDSDLLVFGAKRLLTKLNQYGECVEIERADFASCQEVSLAGWTDAMFRRMAILSGCDYLANINKMGLKTAYRYVRKYKDTEKVLRMIQFEGQFCVPAEYVENFKKAELTFLHHRVFCPIQQKIVFLTELDPGTKEADLPFLGNTVDSETAIGVACGDLNPRTKQPLQARGLSSSRPPLREQRRQTLPSSADLKPKKSIESFFKGHRQPLAELDPNSLTPSPSQQRLLQTHANASWEMRTVSSAPQLRQTAASTMTTRISSNPPFATDRSAFLARASTISTYQPPKRQRLCSETEGSLAPPQLMRSPFFVDQPNEPSPLAQKKSRSRKARKSAFDIYSDDSVEDVLLGLPDVHQAASPEMSSKLAATESMENRANDYANDGVHSIAESPVRECCVKGSLTVVGRDNSAGADASAPGLIWDEEDESFVDLFEIHESSRSLHQTFICQSPSRRASALASITSPRHSIQPESDAVEAEVITHATGVEPAQMARTEEQPREIELSSSRNILNLSKTFSYQATAAQTSALHSLGLPQSQNQKVKLGKAALHHLGQQPPKKTSSSPETESSTTMATSSKKRVSIGCSSASPGSCAAVSITSAADSQPKGSEDFIVRDSEDDGSEEEQPKVKMIDLKAYAFTNT